MFCGITYSKTPVTVNGYDYGIYIYIINSLYVYIVNLYIILYIYIYIWFYPKVFSHLIFCKLLTGNEIKVGKNI